jgi:hypothetical protein
MACTAGAKFGGQGRRAADTAPRGGGIATAGGPAAGRLGQTGRGRCWPGLPGCCPGGPGVGCWSNRLRCCAGSVIWSGAAGATRTGVAVRLWRPRSATWCCGWPGRTRPGGAAASRASCAASGTGAGSGQQREQRLDTLDQRPHTFEPMTAFAQADAPSQPVEDCLLDTTGCQPNDRLLLPATACKRFAGTRELTDGLLSPRFAPSQCARGARRLPDLLPDLLQHSIDASIPKTPTTASQPRPMPAWAPATGGVGRCDDPGVRRVLLAFVWACGGDARRGCGGAPAALSRGPSSAADGAESPPRAASQRKTRGDGHGRRGQQRRADWGRREGI